MPKRGRERREVEDKGILVIKNLVVKKIVTWMVYKMHSPASGVSHRKPLLVFHRRMAVLPTTGR
jgi:hypothetical protein